MPHHQLALIGLGLLTLVVLLLNLPNHDIASGTGGILLIYGLLTALGLNFGIRVEGGKFSATHAISLLALLSLPAAAAAYSLWAIALGGLVGGLIAVRSMQRTAGMTRLFFLIARVTLSFYSGALVYNGVLPLGNLTVGDLLPVIVFGVVTSAVYLALFVFQVYAEGWDIGLLRASALEIVIILLLPLPFAVVGAVIYNTLTPLSFSLYLLAFALIVIHPQGTLGAQLRLRRQVEELSSIADMSKAIRADLELETLLDVVYRQVSRLLRVDNFMVALYAGAKLEFPLNVEGGAVQPRPPLVADDLDPADPLYRVLETEQPLLVTVRAPGALSWLGVPLLASGHLLGALVVQSSDPRRRFDANDLRLLSIVAATTGVALENVQLYQRQNLRVTELATLNRVLTLLTDTLSPGTVSETVLAAALDLTGAKAASLYQFWDEAKLAFVSSLGFGADAGELPEPLLVSARTQLSPDQQPLVITDAAQDDLAAALRPALGRLGMAAWIELPLIYQGVVLGVLVVYIDQPREFSPETVELLRTFANQSAQAMTNARLYAITDETLERRVGQLLALAAIGHKLTTALDLPTICDLVAEYAQETTEARAAGVVLINDDHTIGELAAPGYPPGALNKSASLISGGITGRAISTGEAVVVSDVRVNPEYIAVLPQTRSQLSTPILWGDAVVGVITLESDQINAFSEEDTYFVKQLASQAAIAIENARLFQTTAEARDRMQVILNTVKEAMILIDTEGDVVLANPRVELIDLSPDALIGYSVEALLDDPDLNLSQRLGFRTGGELMRLIRELRAPGGLASREAKTFTVETDDDDTDLCSVQRQVFPVYDEEDRPLGVLLVFYDETEERKLSKTREEVSQMLIHDLRSPLTAVVTSLKLLTELTPKDSSKYALIETTVDASRRVVRKLLTRVDSLLDVARMENNFMTVDQKPTELATLVDNVCVELSPLAQELDVVVVADLNADLPLLDVDSDKIERVLLNLVDNALKFSPAESAVIVRAYEPGAEGAAPGFVRIDVVDAGPGVPDEYKLMLFDRFVQIRGRSGARRGTGIGLTFCRLVAEAHGGRIWISDNPTGGSIFSFTLPAALENELSTGTD